jgi:hypothetical protein
MALQHIFVGEYPMDAKGDLARNAFIKTNSMFAELFTLAGLTGQQQVINVGAMPNSTPPGTVSNKAFPMINGNFQMLFIFVARPSYQEIILMGGEAGMIIGENAPVIGTGDPARTAWQKVNANFTYLYQVL